MESKSATTDELMVRFIHLPHGKNIDLEEPAPSGPVSMQPRQAVMAVLPNFHWLTDIKPRAVNLARFRRFLDLVEIDDEEAKPWEHTRWLRGVSVFKKPLYSAAEYRTLIKAEFEDRRSRVGKGTTHCCASPTLCRSRH